MTSQNIFLNEDLNSAKDTIANLEKELQDSYYQLEVERAKSKKSEDMFFGVLEM